MNIVTKCMIGFIKLYQLLLSPYIGQQCRFYPTCSHYAIETFKSHGTFLGLYFTVKRLLKCHPWHPGGHDPIP